MASKHPQFPRLRELVRHRRQRRHYNPRTAGAYVCWMRIMSSSKSSAAHGSLAPRILRPTRITWLQTLSVGKHPVTDPECHRLPRPQRTEARSGVIDILLTPKDEEDVKYGKEPSMSVRAPFKRKWVRRPTINTSVTPWTRRPPGPAAPLLLGHPRAEAALHRAHNNDQGGCPNTGRRRIQGRRGPAARAYRDALSPSQAARPSRPGRPPAAADSCVPETGRSSTSVAW